MADSKNTDHAAAIVALMGSAEMAHAEAAITAQLLLDEITPLAEANLALCYLERDAMLADARNGLERAIRLLDQFGPKDLPEWDGYKVAVASLSRLSTEGK